MEQIEMWIMFGIASVAWAWDALVQVVGGALL